MSYDLSPEAIIRHLDNHNLAPFYLFYGPSEFLKETVLAKLKKLVLDPATAELNYQSFYADEAGAEQVIEAARSLPFMSDHRVVVVRRAEAFSRSDQEKFLPYLDSPVESTYLIFLTVEGNLRHPLFSRIRKYGTAVRFLALKETQVITWLLATARDMGINISREACAYLRQIVGDRLMELHGELQKLATRYGSRRIGVEQVQEMATKTRPYSVFELMDHLSEKDCKKALEALHRLLDQGGKNSALPILGMLNRQFRLLWKARHLTKGGAQKQAPSALGVPPFLARKLLVQAGRWSEVQLRDFLESLCLADSRLKSGSQENVILDHLVISLCKGYAGEDA